MLSKSINKTPFFLLAILLIVKMLFPTVSFANADKIFKENNKAVVVVVAFDEKNKPISQGSGFIVRHDGAIVTNYHVISNAKAIAVKAGEKVKARLGNSMTIFSCNSKNHKRRIKWPISVTNGSRGDLVVMDTVIQRKMGRFNARLTALEILPGWLANGRKSLGMARRSS